MIHFNYKTKKELKSQVGERLNYTETSIFGAEYRENGTITGANPKHSWVCGGDNERQSDRKGKVAASRSGNTERLGTTTTEVRQCTTQDYS